MDASPAPVPSPDATARIVHTHSSDGVLSTDHLRQDAQELDHEAALHESTSVTPNGLRSDHQLEQNLSASSTMTRSTPVTRTVAIIKNHALHHRLDIEPRIQEARFEIVKERPMEFDTETDPDALYDLFGEDADSLAEGPVWVYVLERKRAVEVWNTLMGDSDPEVARVQAPNSLRALYGISHQQNAFMGSPDTQTAEIQIAALFASSPLFSSTDLPPESDRYGSVRSISSSVLEALRADQSDQGHPGYAPSSVTNPSTVGGGSNGKPSFKARPVPATHIQPDIVPRMSRAAALRIGAPVEKSPNKPRTPPTKAQLAKTFANVPGHKRTETIAVASTAPPAIAPRMTKAASLRLGKEAAAATGGRPRPPPPMKKRSVTDGAVAAAKAQATFEGVPGHKRRETISVASVKPPVVAPRSNKSAVLRQSQKEGGGPAPSAAFRTPSAISRTTSTSTAASRRQSIAAPQRAESQVSRRSTSALAIRSSTSTNSEAADPISPTANDNNNGTGAGMSRPASVASKPRPRPSSVVLPPTIAPRTNKSAALRAAKMEAEAAAAAAAAAKKTARVSRPPPSSFKSSTVAT